MIGIQTKGSPPTRHIREGGIYRHFKGNLYIVFNIAEHTETKEKMVVYMALYGDMKLYVRPLDMFLSKVDKEKYPNADQEYRFQLELEKSSNFMQLYQLCKNMKAIKNNLLPKENYFQTAVEDELGVDE